MLKLFYIFTIRNIIKKPMRWILSFLSIVLGVTLFVSISLINDAVLQVFQQNINAVTGKSQISITSGERGLSDQILRVIEDTPGVYSAAPILENSVLFKNKKAETSTLMIMAVDLLRDTNFRDYDPENPEVIEDPLTFFNQEDSLIVTHEFADKNNLKTGDPLELITVEGPKTFIIRGLLKPTGAAKAYGGGLALMDIMASQFIFRKEGLLDRIDVLCDESQDIDQVIKNIKSRIDSGFDVERAASRNQQTEAMVKSFQRFISLIGAMAWFIGLFFIFNSIYISVAQRRSEIGILRGLGSDRKTILWLFIFEALSMGILGTLLGLFAGEYAGQYLVDDVTTTLSVQFQTTIQSPYITLTTTTFIQTLIISVFATFLAALWPSLQATLVHPIEAIKAKAIELYNPEKTNFSISWIWIGLLFLAVLLIAKFANPMESLGFALLIFLISLCFSLLMVLKLTPLLLDLIENLFKSYDWVPGLLALQNIKSSKGTLYANMGALFLSLFFYAFFATTSQSVKYTVQRYLKSMQYFDLNISTPGNQTSYQGLPLKPELLTELKQLIQDPSTKQPLIASSRTLLVNFEHQKIRLHALSDTQNYAHPENTLLIKEDNPVELLTQFFQSKENLVFVSEAFMRNFKVKPGDSIRLQTPTGSTAVKILGKVEDMTSAQGAIFMNLKNYQENWKDPLLSFIMIKLPKDSDLTSITQLIESKFTGPHGLILLNKRDLSDEINKSINQSFEFTNPIKISALFVGLLTLLSTFSVRLLTRIKEFGVLRAIGMTKIQLAQFLILEIGVQGALASVFTFALGTPVLYVWSKYLLTQVLGWYIYPSIPWGSLFFMVLLGILISIFAGIYPITKSIQREVKDVLQYE